MFHKCLENVFLCVSVKKKCLVLIQFYYGLSEWNRPVYRYDTRLATNKNFNDFGINIFIFTLERTRRDRNINVNNNNNKIEL